MPRIFLSHLRDDGALARRLAEALRRAGHQPLLVEDELRVGDTALSVLERSLRDADVGVLCLSRAALADAWMQTEFQTVQSQLEARGKPSLVARFDWAQPQGSVALKPAVDLFPEAAGWDEGISTLVEVLERLGEGAAREVWPLLLGIPPAPEVFVDREEVLRQLHEELEPRPGQAGERRATLLGPVGIGKSAIALRFAHDAAKSFPGGIWWCEEQAGTPEGDLARLFQQIRRWAPLALKAPLDSVGPDAPVEERARAVRRALEGGHQPSLLIVDGTEQDWAGALPGSPVSVLMVRQQGVGAVGKQVLVEPLPAAAALQLVDALSETPEDPEEREARLRLVSEVSGGLPIALTLAAQLQRNGIAWSRIEQVWRAARMKEPSQPGAEGLIAPLLDAILSSLTPATLRLLEAMATFAPAPVPVDWLSALARDDAERGEFNRAGQELQAWGLLTWNQEDRTVLLRSLVHSWARKQTQASRREQLLRESLDVMEAWLRPRIPLLRPEHVAGLEAYLPHFLEALEATRSLPPSEVWIRLTVEVSTMLMLRSEQPRALEWLERALLQAEQLQHSLHQLNCLVELAFALQSMGWEQRAAPYVQRALALADGLLETPDITFVGALNKLAVLVRKKDPERARRLAERAVQAAERTLGADHMETAILLSNLALTTEEAEGAAAAIPLFKRALEILERRLGQESSFVAQLAAAYALALAHTGDLAGARELMEKAVAIDERLLPPDHLEVADRLKSMAFILMEMGEFASARPLLERALAIEETKLGPENPVLASTLHNLGFALLELGSAREAEAVLLRAAALEEAGLSPDDPMLADTRMVLAAVAGRLGDRRAAALHLEKALDVGMTLYAPEAGPGQQPLEKALRLARGRQVNPQAYVTALTESLALAEREGDLTNAARAALLLGAFEGRAVLRHLLHRGMQELESATRGSGRCLSAPGQDGDPPPQAGLPGGQS